MSRYRLSMMDHSQIDTLLALQELVAAQMPEPEFYVSATRQEFCAALEQDFVLGGYEENELIAAAVCIRNRACSGNLGQKFGAEPTEAFTFDAVFVHPEHRGKGLQSRLIEAAKKIAKEAGAASMWCTVAPDNLFSYRNFTRAGFAPVEKNKLMYGGRVRDVLKMVL